MQTDKFMADGKTVKLCIKFAIMRCKACLFWCAVIAVRTRQGNSRDNY